MSPKPTAEARATAQLCVRARGMTSGAARCERLCPSAAIRVDDGDIPGPRIDSERCAGCGLCVVACPVGAFEPADGERARVESEVRGRLLRAEQIGFRCAGPGRAGAPLDDDAARTNDVQVSCLGAIGQGTLTACFASGASAVWLDDRHCRSCEWRRGAALCRLTVKRTRRLLRAYGIPPKITFDSREARPEHANAEWTRKVDRRGFLTRLRPDPKPEATWEQAPSSDERRWRVPADRRLLGQALQQLGEPQQKAAAPGQAGMWSVAASESCVCCPVCSALCPTEALELKARAGEAFLSFSAVKCGGCGLCIARCPSHSLRASDVDMGRGMAPVVLASASPTRCQRCRRAILAGERAPLCARCQLTQALSSSANAGARRTASGGRS